MTNRFVAYHRLHAVNGATLIMRGNQMPEFDSSYRVLRRRGEPDLRSLEAYRRAGGYSALERAIREQTPEQVIQLVLDAKLRGRGGAGRPTGEKWRIVRRQDD